MNTGDFLFQPMIALPDNLTHLKYLVILLDTYYSSYEKKLSPLSNIPGLQFLSLIFLGSKMISRHNGTPRLKINNLPKVRQMEIHLKPINSEGWIDLDETESCDIEINNAPSLEILVIRKALVKETSKIKIIYSDCPRLKFVKNHGLWVSEKLTVGGKGEINLRCDEVKKPSTSPPTIHDRKEIKVNVLI